MKLSFTEEQKWLVRWLIYSLCAHILLAIGYKVYLGI